MKISQAAILIILIIVILYAEEIKEAIQLIRNPENDDDLQDGPIQISPQEVKAGVADYFSTSPERLRAVLAERANHAKPNTQKAMAYLMDMGADASTALIEIKKFIAAGINRSRGVYDRSYSN